MSAQRNPRLDGLRGVAAILVLLFHLWLYSRPNPPAGSPSGGVDWAWSSARIGLILFFVLSGFLLYRPWVEAANGNRRRPDVVRYLRARAARILPAYYLALAGSVLLLWGAGAVPGVRLPSADTLPLFLAFGQNFTTDSLLTLDPPMWTLAVEASFYAVLPALGVIALRIRPGRRQLLAPLALIVVGLTWSNVVSAEGGGLVLTKALPAMLPFFAVGMLGAVWEAQRDRVPIRSRWLGLFAAIAIVINVALRAWVPSVATALHDLPAAAGFGACVVVAAAGRGSLLATRPLVALGSISYGVYLWHVPILWWLRSQDLLPLNPIAALPVLLVPTLVVAIASWRYVEHPAITWVRRRRLVVAS